MSNWLSDKAVRYILSPKRRGDTQINPIVATTITAKGQMNWTGTFISPDIVKIKRTGDTDGDSTTIIYLVDGRTIYYKG